MQGVRVQRALNGVTTSSTSTAMWVGDWEKVGFLFRGAAISSGNGVFLVQVAQTGNASDVPTEAQWVNYSMLVDNVAADAGNAVAGKQTGYTRVASKTLSANGDVTVWMDPLAFATHVRVIVNRTTDGTYTADVCGFSIAEI